MKHFILLLILISFTIQTPFNTIRLWPQPKHFTNGSETLYIPNPCSFPFEIKTSGNPKDIQTAIEIYRFIIFPSCKPGSSQKHIIPQSPTSKQILGAIIQVDDPVARPLTFSSDESYTISLPYSQKVLITAKTHVGVLRALETLSQLILFLKQQYFIPLSPWNIQDAPRFKYRGLLVDTARHFIPKKDLMRQIDGLLYSKMNVLHWHITDSQSFPLELKSYPEITKYGAFTPEEVYTVNDVKEIVEYAIQRGVRIIPEIDTPGHARAFGLSPNLADIIACPELPNPGQWPKYCMQPPCGQLDPTVNLTYKVLDGLYHDLRSLFPDEVYHLGFDEGIKLEEFGINWKKVNYNCWDLKKSIGEYMKKHNIKDYAELLNIFLLRQRELLPDKTAMYWIMKEKGLAILEKDIIHVWGDRAQILRVLAEYKNRIVLSPYTHLYLDCGHGGMFGDNSWCDPYKTWKHIYLFEPFDNITKPEDKERILGGVTASWGELTDHLNMDNKIWPRTSVLGERLWSPEHYRDFWDARLRLSQHVDRLQKRGVQASAIADTFCLYHPDKCKKDGITGLYDDRLKRF